MRLQLELVTCYVDVPTKRRWERLGFQATGKTRRLHEMRRTVQTVELASPEDVQAFLRDHGATWDGYGPIRLEGGGG